MAQTTVPLNTPTEQPTRRALLGTMAAAGIVSAAPAMAAGETLTHTSLGSVRPPFSGNRPAHRAPSRPTSTRQSSTPLSIASGR